MSNEQSDDRVSWAGRKLLALLSEKGVIGLFSHIHTVLLHRVHERISPSPAMGPEAVPTTENVELYELTINSENRKMGVYYAPTPRLIFH